MYRQRDTVVGKGKGLGNESIRLVRSVGWTRELTGDEAGRETGTKSCKTVTGRPRRW